MLALFVQVRRLKAVGFQRVVEELVKLSETEPGASYLQEPSREVSWGSTILKTYRRDPTGAPKTAPASQVERHIIVETDGVDSVVVGLVPLGVNAVAYAAELSKKLYEEVPYPGTEFEARAVTELPAAPPSPVWLWTATRMADDTIQTIATLVWPWSDTYGEAGTVSEWGKGFRSVGTSREEAIELLNSISTNVTASVEDEWDTSAPGTTRSANGFDVVALRNGNGELIWVDVTDSSRVFSPQAVREIKEKKDK